MTTREDRAQRIEFCLQSKYNAKATIHRGCICVEPCRHALSRRRSTVSTLEHKVALYVDDVYIDEHTVDARYT